MTAKKSRKRLRKKKVGNRQRKKRKKQARETKNLNKALFVKVETLEKKSQSKYLNTDNT
jgi:hypothetical protein